ncbi:glycosyltransferase [Cysteiniphilum sp. 6C5]|uniref:glycosyltransferase n=1 Tax=unclassified Cysteiniphilum TaxID=2610889 RepID=UPI003F878EAD
MYLVSVVIPTYNRQNLLKKTLASLSEQMIDKNSFEVIVVDDGGDDDSQDLVESFKAKINVKYLWQEDLGFRVSKARNLGALNASGEILTFVDSGVVLHSQSLSSIIEQHQNAEKDIATIGYVYGFEVDFNQHPYLRDQTHQADEYIDYCQRNNIGDIRDFQYNLLGRNISTWPAPFDIYWTCLATVSKESFMKAGMFDESYTSWGGEDVDLGIRLYLQGNCFLLNKQALGFHCYHDNNDSKDDSQTLAKSLELHQRYQLWQTCYYKYIGENLALSKLGGKLSLNVAIYLFDFDESIKTATLQDVENRLHKSDRFRLVETV